MKTIRSLLITIGLALALLAASWDQPALGALFVVNDQRDLNDADLTDNRCDCNVVTVGDQCTLRAAIMQANHDPNEDQINFSVPSINPTSSLPEITNPLNILGKHAGKPVVLDGSVGNIPGPGLWISAGNSKVQDLVIIGFDTGLDASGIKLSGSTGANEIEKCFVGTDEAGTFAIGNGIGILIYNSDNTIGGSQAARNIISGNDSHGILIKGLDAHDNLILGNYIGTDPTGTVGLRNGGAGVKIDENASANDVGGANGIDSRNVISGNDIGVHVRQAESNKVLGNYIGIDVNGTNGLGNARDGVIIGGSSNNIIGGTAPPARNIISDNGEKGITISGSGSMGNKVEGNFIGTDMNGTASLGNDQDGVSIEYAPNNTIGGSVAARNVISGNKRDGVVVQGIDDPDYYANDTIVSANHIGTCVNGQTDLGNGQNGVRIRGAQQVTIGGLAGEESRNLISGNDEHGIRIESSYADIVKKNNIQGNYIGTDVSGEGPLPNSMSGIYMEEAHENVIGGSVAARNIISGNAQNGIKIYDVFLPDLPGNRIEGNYIGTGVGGTNAVENREDGINIYYSPNNTVGGSSEESGNLISGNAGNGIKIYGIDSTGNQVQGNYIGTDKEGISAIRNGADGINISSAPNNVAGGSTDGSGNVISGNSGDGIEIIGSDSTGNRIQRNYIGTDKDGEARLGNLYNGVTISFSPSNIIGGMTADNGNLISGNLTNGVEIWGSGATGNEVRANLIGTDHNGTEDLGNTEHGVYISSAGSNLIGGTGQDSSNIIAFNGKDGVYVLSGSENGVLGNSIFNNGGLGIDLWLDGITANDPGDTDTGANDLQNFPELSIVGDSVVASLNSIPSSEFRLEFFANHSCDPSGNGEGRTFLKFLIVNTDGDGNAEVDTGLNGTFITSTATGPEGSTSEFSPCASTPVELDYGDAPQVYPTVTASNGAYHVVSNALYLGSGVDSEQDGQPDEGATGDDNDGNDDEDGVEFLTPMGIGRTADINIEASGAGMLNAWLDFNQDGDWEDVGEQIFTNLPLTMDTNELSIDIPLSANLGISYARFRFSTQGNLSFTGGAMDGEIEDYQVELIELDTDGDGLPDRIEDISCTFSTNPDSDKDGLRDGIEDTDLDGVWDLGETNPCDADTDGDGMPDGYEVDQEFNPLEEDSHEDADNDGFSNLREYYAMTDPHNDGDTPEPVSDRDDDTDIDGVDLAGIALEMGSEDCAFELCNYDLDLDGDVDDIDLLFFTEDFGQ